MLNAALDDLVEVGYLAPEIRPGAEVTCWSAVHGFSVLVVEGPLRGLQPADRDAALDAMLTSIDLAYGSRRDSPGLRVADAGSEPKSGTIPPVDAQVNGC